MATGQDQITLQRLLDAVERVKFNRSDATTSELIQQNDKDIILTLWNKINAATGSGTIINTTHGDLVNLINSNTLIPGAYYIFEFETIHLVGNQLPTNKDYRENTLGQANPIETLIVKALTPNTLQRETVSLTYPQDLLYYYPNPYEISVGVFTLGVIYRRVETERNLDLPYDFRNQLVTRQGVDFPNIPLLDSTTKGNLGLSVDNDYVFQVEDNSTYSNSSSSQTFIDGTDTSFNTAIPENSRLSSLFSGALTAPNYYESIDLPSDNNPSSPSNTVGLSTNISIKPKINNRFGNYTLEQWFYTSLNIYIRGSSGISIDGITERLTLEGVKGLNAKTNNKDITVLSSSNITLGNLNEGVFIYFSNDVKVGDLNGSVSICSSSSCKVGSNNSTCNLTGGSTSSIISIGSNNTDIYLSGENSKIGSNNTFLSLEGMRRVYLEDNNSSIGLKDCYDTFIGSSNYNFDFLDFGSSIYGNGKFTNCRIESNVNNLDISGRVINTIIGFNVSDLVVNYNIIDSYFASGITNMIIEPFTNDSFLRGRFLNSYSGGGDTYTLPDSESKTFYFESPIAPATVGNLISVDKSSDTVLPRNLTGITNGDELAWNGTEFIPKTPVNFDLTGIVAGDYIRWDAVNGQFVKTTPEAVLPRDITGILNGQILVWTGTQFTPVNFPSVLARDLTGITIGQGLAWDGVQFIPTTLFPYDLTGIQDGDALVWDTDKFVRAVLYDRFTKFAEENGNLVSNSDPWSLGNGATGLTGIVIPYTADLDVITFQSVTAGTSVVIEILRNDTLVASGTFAADGVVDVTPVVSFNKGDKLGFRTGTVVGTFNNARVVAGFRKPII